MGQWAGRLIRGRGMRRPGSARSEGRTAVVRTRCLPEHAALPEPWDRAGAPSGTRGATGRCLPAPASGGRSAREQALGMGDHLLEHERLGEEVLGPLADSRPGLGAVERRHHQHGDRGGGGILLEQVQEAEARDAGELEVQHDQIRRRPRQSLQRGQAILKQIVSTQRAKRRARAR